MYGACPFGGIALLMINIMDTSSNNKHFKYQNEKAVTKR
jgi:hypothetical protein